jgi:hypothetical protein
MRSPREIRTWGQTDSQRLFSVSGVLSPDLVGEKPSLMRSGSRANVSDAKIHGQL